MTFKPRHVVTAMHLQEILKDLYCVLSDFQSKSVQEYYDYSLCLTHYGNIEIQRNEDVDCVFCWDLLDFYHIKLDTKDENVIANRFINYQICIEFTNQMICESMYDWEYSKRLSYSDQFPIEKRCGHWLNDDKHKSEIINGYKWIGDYIKVANNELNELLYSIHLETNISGIHLYILKDYLLENIYDIKGYMPKRYDKYRYDYARIFSEIINEKKIDHLDDEILGLQHKLIPYIKNAMPEIDLFTEAKIKEIVEHIINVYVSYNYYELGKFLVVSKFEN